MDKNTILENYQDYLTRTKTLAPSTLKRRILYAKNFMKYLEDNKLTFDQITKDTLNGYFNSNPVGIQNRKEGTSSFIEYLVTQNIITFSRCTGTEIKGENSYPEIMEKYLKHIERKGVSQRTIDITRSLIRRFLDYLSSHNITSITAVTKKIISDYSTYILLYKTKRNKPYNANTRANILSNINSFFDFLRKENIILSNPAQDIEFPKLPKRISRDIPTVEEIDRLVACIDKTSLTGIRDIAIIETLYGTGIRGNELIKLELKDIDFENNLLTVRQGKGKKDRTIPINDTALHWIKEYLNKRDTPQNSPLVFLNIRGERLHTTDLCKLISKYSLKAGIKKHLIPHSFRYACATHMLKNGADIRYIQEMLGHDSLNTTQRYTKVIKSDLKRMLRKFHPRDAVSRDSGGSL